MLDITDIKQKFGLDESTTKDIQSINANMITKFTVIEGCCAFFNPHDLHDSFHCSKAQKNQQATINLLALVTCAKAISDDLTEITRVIFQNKLNKNPNPWYMSNDYLKSNYSNKPLTSLLDKYGLYNSKSPSTTFQKMKRLRDTLIHRQIEDTYYSSASQFFVYGNFTHSGNNMTGYDYSQEIHKLMKNIVKDINNCFINHGVNCLL